MQILPYSTTCALLLSASVVSAQGRVAGELPLLINSGKVLQKDIKPADKDEFDAASACCPTVTPSDSALVKTELSLTYLTAKRYQESVNTASHALASHFSGFYSYNMLGLAYRPDGLPGRGKTCRSGEKLGSVGYHNSQGKPIKKEIH